MRVCQRVSYRGFYLSTLRAGSVEAGVTQRLRQMECKRSGLEHSPYITGVPVDPAFFCPSH